MSERFKVNVRVSSEINTILRDLYNQIQFELMEQYEEEIERLQKEKIELQETIRLANNNILKDISMIKTIGMERQEIIQRLFETSKILVGSDKE